MDFQTYTYPVEINGEVHTYCGDHHEPTEFLEIDDDGYAHMICPEGHTIREMT